MFWWRINEKKNVFVFVGSEFFFIDLGYCLVRDLNADGKLQI